MTGIHAGSVAGEGRAICPHCGAVATFSLADGGRVELRSDDDEDLLTTEVCIARCPSPNCREPVIDLVTWAPTGMNTRFIHSSRRLHPEMPALPPMGEEIPAEFSELVTKAARVRHVAPEAAAVLLRKCLERVLRQRYDLGERPVLARLVEAAVNDPAISGHLHAHFDLLREVGNWGAHANDELHVEPNEVDQLLVSITEALDFFYVKPASVKRAQERINAKLTQAGRAPLPRR